MKTAVTYPYCPQSCLRLLPGDFWGIPLSDGTFACGRVIEVPVKQPGSSRVMFLAGLLDWHGGCAPTSDLIAGRACLHQAQGHLKLITEAGGLILGHRSLDLDGIEPGRFRGAAHWKGSMVYHGLRSIRPQTPDDENLPILSTWGYKVPLRLAEQLWVVRTAPEVSDTAYQYNGEHVVGGNGG